MAWKRKSTTQTSSASGVAAPSRTHPPTHSDAFRGGVAVGEYLLDGEDDRRRAWRRQQESSELGSWLAHAARGIAASADNGTGVIVDDKVDVARKMFRTHKHYTVRLRKLSGAMSALSPGQNSNDDDDGDGQSPASPSPPRTIIELAARRKLKEFHALHAVLRDRFPGALVPHVPRSVHARGTDDAAAVTALRGFLGEVARSPLFRADSALEAFCDPAVPKFTARIPARPDNCGALHWKDVLETVPLPRNADQWTRAACAELASLQAAYGALRDHVTRMQRSCSAQAKEQRETAALWAAFVKKEAGLALVFGRASDASGDWGLAGPACTHASVSMPGVVGAMIQAAEARADSLVQEAADVTRLTLRRIAYEMRQLGELQALAADARIAAGKHVADMAALAALHGKLQQLRQDETGGLVPAQPQFPDAQLAEPRSPASPESGGGSSSSDGGMSPTTPPTVATSPATLMHVPRVPPTPSSSASKRSVKLAERAGEMETTLRSRQRGVKRLLRGLVVELDRFRYERTVRAAEMVRDLVSLQQTQLAHDAQLCAKLLEGLPVVPVPHLALPASVAAFVAQPDAFADDDESSHMASQQVALQQHGPQQGQQDPYHQQQQQQGSESARASLRVRYAFSAETEEEVDLAEGEFVEVVQRDTDEDGWCRVRTSTGRVGLAPFTYLSVEDHATREGHVESMGEEEQKDGAALSVAVPVPRRKESASEVAAEREHEEDGDKTPQQQSFAESMLDSSAVHVPEQQERAEDGALHEDPFAAACEPIPPPPHALQQQGSHRSGFGHSGML